MLVLMVSTGKSVARTVQPAAAPARKSTRGSADCRLDGEGDAPGTLELSIEATEGGIIENADNLTIAPWGDLFVCEDGPPGNGLVRISPDGTISRFALNRVSGSELAGACFSPDGRTLFVNIQHQGLTVAIDGPWKV